MDSSAYKYLLEDYIKRSTTLSSSLPVQFSKPDFSLSEDSFTAIAFFLSQLLPESEENCGSNQADSLISPKLLINPEKSFLSTLFFTTHRKLSTIFGNNIDPEEPSFKHNGKELLTFLCHGISPKWVPLFPENDTLHYAMSCFLIEAFMYIGWCPNAFENCAKRAAHLYFLQVRKSLYSISDKALSTVHGYLYSAWLCAQKTEGIQDKPLAGEHNSLIHHYNWEIHYGKKGCRTGFTMYKMQRPSICMVMSQNTDHIPHPFSHLLYEGKTGLTLFTKDGPVELVELIEAAPVKRQKFNGERLTYLCTTLEGHKIIWIVVIQIFNNTIYRIDTIKSESKSCILSKVELLLENSAHLVKESDAKYFGDAPINSVIELLKNPFDLIYKGQVNKGLSLFGGGEKELPENRSIEMITAWSRGKNITSIDRTNLLGIYES